MNYTERLDVLIPTITGVRDQCAWQDLIKMNSTLRKLAVQLSVSAVECRRIHRPTSTFVALDAKFNELYTELEQWLTFALLKD